MNVHSLFIKTRLSMSSTNFKNVLMDFCFNYRTLMFRPDKLLERIKAKCGMYMK